VKFKISLLAACLLAGGLIVGCQSPPQVVAYNTINTVEQTATVAVNDYFQLAIKGTVSTNGIPTVAKAFNDLQTAGALAAAASQAGGNALASSNLVVEASSLGALITTLETK